MDMTRRWMVVSAILIVSMLLFSGLGTAIQYEHSYEDEKGDVGTKPLSNENEPVDNPDIDLTKVETKKEGSEVVFTLKVDGKIRKTSPENESYNYDVHVLNRGNLSAVEDDVGVHVWYDGNASYWVYNTSETKDTECSISGGEMTINVPEDAFSKLSEFHMLFIASHEIMGSEKGGTDILRSWESSGSNGGDDSSGLPGFGILLMLSSASVATYVYSRSR